MAYKVIILYQLYMPSYFLGTFTEYPYLSATPENGIFSYTPLNDKQYALNSSIFISVTMDETGQKYGIFI